MSPKQLVSEEYKIKNRNKHIDKKSNQTSKSCFRRQLMLLMAEFVKLGGFWFKSTELNIDANAGGGFKFKIMSTNSNSNLRI